MVDPAPAFDPADARWIAHRYALADDSIRYRFVPREDHANFPFLTEDAIGERSADQLSRAQALAHAGEAVPIHFIFHSAYCASTLLARALDRPGLAMGLSEPVILNDIVGIRRRREADSREAGRLFDDALTLLARGWGADEAVVIKPSNILNAVAPGLLTLRPDARAILLHAPLETFLRSVARKGLWCRLWVRELLEGLLTDGIVDLGFEPDDYFRQSDLQVAAVGWLAQHRLFEAMTQQFPGRVASLDSETLLERPAETIEAAGKLFGLVINPEVASEIATGPAFGRHSKDGKAFSSADREVEQKAAHEAHREEIEQVAGWTLEVAKRLGVAIELPAPLLQSS